MYQAKDGKKFGSKFAGRKYDEMHALPAGNPAHEKSESPEFEAGEQEGKVEAKNEGQEQHPIVAEHGRAHTIHMKHDHTANKHHVTSHHEDGHVNESEHPSADEAHAEAGKLAGVAAPEQPQEEGDLGGGEMLDEASSGHKVPHVA